MADLIAVFDLDGTLVDSDAALTATFVALGVPAEEVTFGHTLADECDRLGITVEDYVARYDGAAAHPFPGADELVGGLERWAVCSNKHQRSGWAELDRFGWRPDVALFAEAFGGASKRLEPVLDALAVAAPEVAFVGDTHHDRRCAAEVGCRFILAGWNARAEAQPGDLVARVPHEVAALLVR